MIGPIRSAALIAAFACSLGGTPPATPGAAERSKVTAVAREVMKQARYGTLVTLGEGGQPQARIVDPSEPEADFVIWIATHAATRKVAQLRKDARATLVYFDPATGSYVTLLGSATLVSEAGEKEQHWQAQWAPFYPQGPRTPELVLIRFAPQTLEIVSPRHKLLNDPKSWRPISIELK